MLTFQKTLANLASLPGDLVNWFLALVLSVEISCVHFCLVSDGIVVVECVDTIFSDNVVIVALRQRDISLCRSVSSLLST